MSLKFVVEVCRGAMASPRRSRSTSARLSEPSTPIQPLCNRFPTPIRTQPTASQPQPFHNHFPNHQAAASQPRTDHRQPQPLHNRPSAAFLPSDEKNPPPTASHRLPPPRHRAAKWPDLRSHSEAPTPIQPFPNPDTDAPNRLATTSQSDSTYSRLYPLSHYAEWATPLSLQMMLKNAARRCFAGGLFTATWAM